MSGTEAFFDRLELERRSNEIKEWVIHMVPTIIYGRVEEFVCIIPVGMDQLNATIVKIDPEISKKYNIPELYEGMFELSVTLDTLKYCHHSPIGRGDCPRSNTV